jgi:hypothetical protein
MHNMKKPFWITKLNCWYVKDRHGKQIRLDPDETKAFEMWRKLIDLSNYKHSETSTEVRLSWFTGKWNFPPLS